MIRPIAISLSPNTELDDVVEVIKGLLSPVHWFSLSDVARLEKSFENYFGRGYKALAVNSGRSGLYMVVKALGIGAGDTVAMQALTCVAVPNAILWNDAKPVYIDVDKTLNLDPKDLSEKINEKTKAIIVQHSFGVPAQIDMIKKIAQKKKVAVIEDCALALGSHHKSKKVGTLGDVAVFSFGRDKTISSVFGGLILTKDKKLYEELKQQRSDLAYPSFLWVIQQLLHPVLFNFLILPLYNFGIGKLTVGKLLLFVFQKIGLLSKPVYPMEEIGKRPKIFPQKMPGVLARLANHQFEKLEKFVEHRQKVAAYYFNNLKGKNVHLPPKSQGASWVRFPVVFDNARKIVSYAKSRGVLLGDWYSDLIVPVKYAGFLDYKKGSCPNAQALVGKMLNLPTYPTLSLADAKKVVTLVKSCLNSK